MVLRIGWKVDRQRVASTEKSNGGLRGERSGCRMHFNSIIVIFTYLRTFCHLCLACLLIPSFLRVRRKSNWRVLIKVVSSKITRLKWVLWLSYTQRWHLTPGFFPRLPHGCLNLLPPTLTIRYRVPHLSWIRKGPLSNTGIAKAITIPLIVCRKGREHRWGVCVWEYVLLLKLIGIAFLEIWNCLIKLRSRRECLSSRCNWNGCSLQLLIFIKVRCVDQYFTLYKRGWQRPLLSVSR